MCLFHLQGLWLDAVEKGQHVLCVARVGQVTQVLGPFKMATTLRINWSMELNEHAWIR